MSYACELSLSSARAMKSQAASLFVDFDPMASVQPPDMLVAPGSSPFWVGIGAWAMTSLHSGQGAVPVSSHVPLSHEPSSPMASLPCGNHSLETRLPTFLSSACSGVGPRPLW